jgi:hypothetical protein
MTTEPDYTPTPAQQPHIRALGLYAQSIQGTITAKALHAEGDEQPSYLVRLLDSERVEIATAESYSINQALTELNKKVTIPTEEPAT